MFEPGDQVVCVEKISDVVTGATWAPILGSVYTIRDYVPYEMILDGTGYGAVFLCEDPTGHWSGWGEQNFRKVEPKSELLTRLMANEYDVPAGERDIKRKAPVPA